MFEFDDNSIEMLPCKSKWWEVNIGWGGGLVPKHQAITLTNVDQSVWHHMASQGYNRLITVAIRCLYAEIRANTAKGRLAGIPSGASTSRITWCGICKLRTHDVWYETLEHMASDMQYSK